MQSSSQVPLKMLESGKYFFALLPDQQTQVRAAASQVQAAPFSLRLDTSGSFSGREIVWWLGCREIPQPLAELHRDLDERMSKVGVVPERKKFVPHLTIIRGASSSLPHTVYRSIDWTASEFASCAAI